MLFDLNEILVDSVECYSCSSHTSSSACFTGIFPLDTIEKVTCPGITACQRINNLNGLFYCKNS